MRKEKTMKKTLSLWVALFFAIIAVAQSNFHVTSNFGDIEEGTVLEFNTTDKPESSVNFTIHNNAEFPINMRLKVVSIENSDGDPFEACLGGMCYYKIVEGATYPYPSEPGFETIGPGEANSGGEGDQANHVWNSEEGIDPDEPVVVEFAFQRVDDSGSVVLEELNFTYTYAPELSVDGFDKHFGVQIQNTSINNGELNINAETPATMEIYNLLGQQVKTSKLTAGMNTLDIADLSAQIYLVRIQNGKGELKTQKIVVQ